MSKIHHGGNRGHVPKLIGGSDENKVHAQNVSPGVTTMTEASHPTALAASSEESGTDVDAAHSACITSRFAIMDFSGRRMRTGGLLVCP